jgi:hypothetical protein
MTVVGSSSAFGFSRATDATDSSGRWRPGLFVVDERQCESSVGGKQDGGHAINAIERRRRRSLLVEGKRRKGRGTKIWRKVLRAVCVVSGTCNNAFGRAWTHPSIDSVDSSRSIDIDRGNVMHVARRSRGEAIGRDRLWCGAAVQRSERSAEAPKNAGPYESS